MKLQLVLLFLLFSLSSFAQDLEQKLEALNQKSLEIYEQYEALEEERESIRNSHEDDDVIEAKIAKLNIEIDKIGEVLEKLEEEISAIRQQIDDEYAASANAEKAAKEKLLATLPKMEIALVKNQLLQPEQVLQFGITLKFNDGKTMSSTELGGTIDLASNYDITYTNLYKDPAGKYSVLPMKLIGNKYVEITITDKNNPNITATGFFEIDFNKSYTNNTLFRPTQGNITVGQGNGHVFAIREVRDFVTKKNYYEICFSPYQKDAEFYIVEKGNTVTFNIESVNSSKDWDTRLLIIVDNKDLKWEDVIKLNITGKKQYEYDLIGEFLDPTIEPLKRRFDYQKAKPIIR